MKFFNKLFVLAAASTVLSANISIPGVDTSKCDAALDNIEVECDTTNSQSIFTKTVDYKSFCKTFNKPVCNKLFTKGMSSLEECQNIPEEFLKTFDAVLVKVGEAVGLGCTTDENGEFCALSKITQDNMSKKKEVSMEEAEKAIKEDCGSKTCREAFLKYYTDNQDILNEDGKKVLALLNDQTCVDASKNAPAASATSGAIAMKATGAFAVMTGLLLNYLL